MALFSCKPSGEPSGDNPLLGDYNTPFEVPPFEQIQPEHYMPAFEKGMKEQKNNIEALVSSSEAPTFENTIEAYIYSGELLDRVASVFYSATSATTNDQIQAISEDLSPLMSAHSDEISLNPELFARIKAVYEQRDELDLTDEQAFILENMYKGFVRNGANLSDEKKEELKKLNKELSMLTLKFRNNVLAETNAYQLVIENKEDLAGLPESVIENAASKAEAAGMEGKWIFTTQKPSMLPFLQYADNRDLREELYKAYLNRGNNNDEFDNKDILSEVVKLRVKRSQLLGYKNHAAYRLENRMAGNPDRALELLERLWDAALPVAKEEAKAMQAMIDSEGGDFELASWDWWYYAEKVRKAKFDLDENELRPYFQLANMRDAAFDVANKLFGITFTPIAEIPLPHPDAQAFEVKESDGSHLGVLYMDWHPRASKKGGAWCGDYRGHQVKDGKEITPIVTIVCNFTEPSGDAPALLSPDEVQTLFHEFGHGLDGLFAETSYPASYIAWDFVELPSQIMEHWSMHPEVLKVHAKHYKTGEAIPQEMLTKLDKSSKFNQGFATTEYLAASLLDLAYHTMEEPKDLDIANFEKDYLESMGLIPQIESRYRSTYFNHITGGYDAGYYSYIWAGVLDNDAFEAFKEHGLYDQETARKFREHVLAKNGIQNAMEMYVNFRGREPKEEPLLRNRGLL
ncbi:MAG: M3 family metallopeptidase [Bacteroidota bacterium]